MAESILRDKSKEFAKQIVFIANKNDNERINGNEANYTPH